MVIAQYKCLNCEHRFSLLVDKHSPAPVCLKCQHKIIKWLNYETLAKAGYFNRKG